MGKLEQFCCGVGSWKTILAKSSIVRHPLDQRRIIKRDVIYMAIIEAVADMQRLAVIFGIERQQERKELFHKCIWGIEIDKSFEIWNCKKGGHIK